MTVHVTGLIGSPSLPADVSGSVRLDRLEVHSGGVRVPVEGAEQCCLNRGPIGVVSAIAASPSYPFRRYDKTDVFTLPESAINGLRHGPLQLAADAIVSFTRHRLAGSIPLRPGGSVRTDRYLLEVLSLERYPPRMTLVLLRFTRFPSMATVAAPRLDLFLTDSARRSAAWIAAPWPIATYNAGTTVDNWSRGRTWAGCFTMMFDRQTEVSPDAHLAVVESFDIGTAHTRLTAADVPIQVGPWGAPIY
jgi:hypothetical protein